MSTNVEIDRRDPWSHAHGQARGFLTPEDITAAIVAGAEAHALYRIVLSAMSRKLVEDWSLCAFVAMTCIDGEP